MPFRWIGLFVVCWTAIALVHAFHYAYLYPFSLADAAFYGAVDAYSLAALSSVALWMAWRVPLERYHLWRRVALHLVVGIVAVAGRILALHLVATYLIDRPGLSLWFRAIAGFASHYSLYLLMLGVGLALVYFQRVQERALEASRLEAELTQTEIGRIALHIQPDFLFETLRSITREMHADVEAADRSVAFLGDLLRSSLNAAAQPFGTLDDEVGALESYVNLNALVSQRPTDLQCVVGPEVREASVPRMVIRSAAEALLGLQAEKATETRRLRVTAIREEDDLVVEITAPTHRFVTRSQTADTERLLDQVRSRLDLIVPQDVSINHAGGEAAAGLRIRLPFRIADEHLESPSYDAFPSTGIVQ